MRKHVNIQDKVFFFLSIIACALAVVTNANAQQPQISVELSNDNFSIDQAVRLTVTVNGTNRATIEIPEEEGLIITERGTTVEGQIITGWGTNKLMQSINGEVSMSFSSSYIIQATKTGDYTIPPIKATVKGKQLSTEPINLKVVDPVSAPNNSSTANNQQKQSKLAFVRYIPAKTSGYVGELVPVTVKAYFRTRLSELSIPVVQGTGVILEPFNAKPLQQTEVIAGTTYTTFTWNTTISGVKEGSFSLGMRLNATLLIQQARSQDPFFGRSPFRSQIFDDFFSNNFQSRPVVIETQPFTFDVKPLPTAGRPENFSGAIGNFAITAETSHQKAEVGEPVTLKIGISGQGNFDRVQCPVFPDKENFKTYQPTSDFDAANRTKIFERAVVPQTDKIEEIPAHNFTYFDPDQEQYVTITSAPLPLHVKAAAQQMVQPATPAATTQQMVAQPENIGKPPLNLVPQKLQPGTMTKTIRPTFKQLWFIAVLLLCAVTIIITTILHWRRQLFDQNPAKHKNKIGHALLQNNRKRILQAKESNSSDVISVCRTAIQQQAAHVMGMEAGAITLADLKANPKISDQLVSLFEFTEQSVYGGAPLSNEQLDQFIDQTIQELEGLK